MSLKNDLYEVLDDYNLYVTPKVPSNRDPKEVDDFEWLSQGNGEEVLVTDIIDVLQDFMDDVIFNSLEDSKHE